MTLPQDIEGEAFRQLFRLSREAALYVHEAIEPVLRRVKIGYGRRVTPWEKLCIALRLVHVVLYD